MVEAGPSRPNPNRPWHRGPDRGHGDHISHRMQPFSPDEDFDRPFIGRQIDDPYYYDDYGHGTKRPFYTTVSSSFFPTVYCLRIPFCFVFYFVFLFLYICSSDYSHLS